MAEISDEERAALADPVVVAAIAAAKAGDPGELRRRPLRIRGVPGPGAPMVEPYPPDSPRWTDV